MPPSFLKGFKMGIWIRGGAWISSAGQGLLGDGKEIKIDGREPVIPPAKEVFQTPLARYGRFDTFTRLGCTTAALALKNAGSPLSSDKPMPGDNHTGMIISSLYEIMETDMEYYETTLDEEGTLSSPNLFSYTLPVIVLGETAVHFKLTGPTFCVGEEIEERGLSAVKTAISILNSGKADKMLAGWIDSPPHGINTREGNESDRGAIFLLLERAPQKPLSSFGEVSYNKSLISINHKKTATSIVDLFKEGDSL